MKVLIKNIRRKIYYTCGEITVKIIYYVKKDRWKFIKNGIIAFIGFILSPLSWWNDLFINVPLAYLFAWAVSKVVLIYTAVPRIIFIILFIIGYFITNLVGFLMLHYSVSSLRNNKKYKLTNQIWVSVAYTLIIILMGYLDLIEFIPIETFSIIPDWVN